MSEFSDLFDYDDGLLANNAAWYNIIGNGQAVLGNKFRENAAAGIQATAIDPAFMTFHANGEASILIDTWNNWDFIGVGYRCTPNNGYFVYGGDGRYNLIRVVAGVEEVIGAYTTAGPASAHLLKIKCDDDTISAELNTGSGFSQILSAANETTFSAGQPAVFTNRQGSNGSYGDNFHAIDINGAPVSFKHYWATNSTVTIQ